MLSSSEHTAKVNPLYMSGSVFYLSVCLFYFDFFYFVYYFGKLGEYIAFSFLFSFLKMKKDIFSLCNEKIVFIS